MRSPVPRHRLLRSATGLTIAAAGLAGAFAACSTSRDVVGPSRQAPRRDLSGTPNVRTLDTVVAEASVTVRTADDSAHRAQAARLARPQVERAKGPPTVDNGPYFEFQVEQPATPAPGNMGPRYPQELKQAKVEGTVFAQFVVDTTGLPIMSSFKVLKSDHDLFTQAVRSALTNMKFLPAEVGGRKVKQLVQAPFMFSLTK